MNVVESCKRLILVRVTFNFSKSNISSDQSFFLKKKDVQSKEKRQKVCISKYMFSHTD